MRKTWSKNCNSKDCNSNPMQAIFPKRTICYLSVNDFKKMKKFYCLNKNFSNKQLILTSKIFLTPCNHCSVLRVFGSNSAIINFSSPEQPTVRTIFSEHRTQTQRTLESSGHQKRVNSSIITNFEWRTPTIFKNAEHGKLG